VSDHRAGRPHGSGRPKGTAGPGYSRDSRTGRAPRGGRPPSDPARQAAYEAIAAVHRDDAYANLALPPQPPGTLTLSLPIRRPEVLLPVVELFLGEP